MQSVGMAEGKNRLPELIRMVEAGEHVLITRHGVPVAQLGPPPPPARSARLGGMRGRIRFHSGWDAAVDPDRFLEGEL